MAPLDPKIHTRAYNTSSKMSPYRIQCNSSSNRSPYRIQCNSSSNRSPYRIQCNSSSDRSPYRIQCNSSSNRSPYISLTFTPWLDSFLSIPGLLVGVTILGIVTAFFITPTGLLLALVGAEDEVMDGRLLAVEGLLDVGELLVRQLASPL